MQILDITRDWGAEELNLKNVDIFDPETNIRLGCWYLSKLYKEFGKLDLVIAAYNGGSGNVKKWLENNEYSKDGENLHDIPFKQTSKYVEKVKIITNIIIRYMARKEKTNEENKSLNSRFSYNSYGSWL